MGGRAGWIQRATSGASLPRFHREVESGTQRAGDESGVGRAFRNRPQKQYQLINVGTDRGGPQLAFVRYFVDPHKEAFLSRGQLLEAVRGRRDLVVYSPGEVLVEAALDGTLDRLSVNKLGPSVQDLLENEGELLMLDPHYILSERSANLGNTMMNQRPQRGLSFGAPSSPVSRLMWRGPGLGNDLTPGAHWPTHRSARPDARFEATLDRLLEDPASWEISQSVKRDSENGDG